MNSAAKDIESKVQFWSLIGPVTVACILLIIIVRSTAYSMLLPIVAVSGVLLCYKWKWRGLAAALVALITAFCLQFSLSTHSDWLWVSILTLSIASSFILTSLSFEQAGHAFKVVEDQSEDYKETIYQFDEKLRGFQEKLLQERQDFQTHIQRLQGEISDKNEKVLASEKTVAFVRDELANQEENQRRLLQELHDSQQYAHQLELQFSSPSYTANAQIIDQELDPFAHSQPSAQVKDQNAQIITKYEAEIASLRSMHEEFQISYHKCLQDMQQQAEELANLKELHEISNRTYSVAEEQQIVQQAITQELNDHIENLTREKQLLESTLVRLQGELEALIVQEEEQSRTLSDCQESIVQLRSSMTTTESALELERSYFKSYKFDAESRERDLILQVEELTRKWASVSQQIGDWQRKLEDYHQLSDKAHRSQQQIESLLAEKLQLENQLQDLELRQINSEKLQKDAKNQIETLLLAKQEIDQLPLSIDPLLPEADREIRRLTGLYNQLKEQFADKSAVLDSTRKELFYMQEKLQALQLESHENDVYSEHTVSKEMSRLLAIAEEERNCLEQDYLREIEQLHELIGTFILSFTVSSSLGFHDRSL